jgi:hypothetical protein
VKFTGEQASGSGWLLLASEILRLYHADTALDVCTAALLAEHPTLGHELRPAPEPSSLREARRLIAAALRFRRTIGRYRNAVIDSILSRHDESDPF